MTSPFIELFFGLLFVVLQVAAEACWFLRSYVECRAREWIRRCGGMWQKLSHVRSVQHYWLSLSGDGEYARYQLLLNLSVDDDAPASVSAAAGAVMRQGGKLIGSAPIGAINTLNVPSSTAAGRSCMPGTWLHIRASSSQITRSLANSQLLKMTYKAGIQPTPLTRHFPYHGDKVSRLRPSIFVESGV